MAAVGVYAPAGDIEPMFGVGEPLVPYAPSMLFAAVTIDRDDRRVLSITGDVDLASAPDLRRHLARAVIGVDELVVDLSAVGFLDSVGLGLLVGAARRVPRLVVVAPEGGTSRRALESTRLTEILDVRDLLA